MDKFTENLTGGLRRFAMAGVGAVALTIEKSKEIIDRLAERGEVTAADGAAACDNLQKKMNEQLDAFTAKLRADYEQASFERLLQQCAALPPEQKAQLIERLTAEPEDPACAESEETECSCGCAESEETGCACSDSEQPECACESADSESAGCTGSCADSVETADSCENNVHPAEPAEAAPGCTPTEESADR